MTIGHPIAFFFVVVVVIIDFFFFVFGGPSVVRRYGARSFPISRPFIHIYIYIYINIFILKKWMSIVIYFVFFVRPVRF